MATLSPSPPPPLLSPKPKKRLPFSLLLLFLPTSLLALSFSLLFLLACSGLGLLCLPHDPLPPLQTPSLLPSSLLAVKREDREETHLPFRPQSLINSHFSTNGYPHSNPKKPKRSKSLLKFLHPTPQSKRFSIRTSLFFNSSSCNCNPRFFMTWISPLSSFGQRELFSIESLFKSHPTACLLIVSSTLDSPKGASLLRPFSAKGFRVAALSPDFAFLFRSTPAERWFDRLRRGEVEPGDVSIGQNLSNLIRLVVLYKYGGIYIDTDVIVTKSFSALKNAIGAQTIDTATGNWTRLNNAVMVFDKKHPLLFKFIEEFSQTFDGSKWGHNGPYLVSRVAARVIGRPGFEFTILPPPAFYPVGWSRIRGLFQGPQGGEHSKWVVQKVRWIREQSFAVHLWNRQSRRLKVEQGSVIGRIMEDCCLFCNSSVVGMKIARQGGSGREEV